MATGSTDLPYPFAGATYPGVFSARGLQILLNLHRVRPGRRFAIIGGAADAEELAVDVMLGGGGLERYRARAFLSADGVEGVRGLTVGQDHYAVDVIAIAVGRQADPALATMVGTPLAFSTARWPDPAHRRPSAQPDCRDSLSPEMPPEWGASPRWLPKAASPESRRRRHSVWRAMRTSRRSAPPVDRNWRGVSPGERHCRPSRPSRTRKSGRHARHCPGRREDGGYGATLTCRCEEILLEEIVAAFAAGAQTVDDVKRRTRAGMGACQGIFCVPVIAAMVAQATGVPIDRVAGMTMRPPVRPLALEALATLNGLVSNEDESQASDEE